MFLLQNPPVILSYVLILCHLTESLTFPFAKHNKDDKGLHHHTVQVCQNKDCCQRWNLSYQTLPETLQDLLPPDAAALIQMETTNCLSLCGKGPNVCIRKHGKEEVHLNGMAGPMSLADELEDKLDIKVPSKLVAAVTVMEKAEKAPLDDKDRFYTSVIQVLKNDPVLYASSALARALTFRAQALCEQGRWDEALEATHDALNVVESLSSSSYASIAAMAWRTTADCNVQLGQMDQAVAALQQWAEAKPLFHTKAQNEIQQLLEAQAQAGSG